MRRRERVTECLEWWKFAWEVERAEWWRVVVRDREPQAGSRVRVFNVRRSSRRSKVNPEEVSTVSGHLLQNKALVAEIAVTRSSFLPRIWVVGEPALLYGPL